MIYNALVKTSFPGKKGQESHNIAQCNHDLPAEAMFAENIFFYNKHLFIILKDEYVLRRASKEKMDKILVFNPCTGEIVNSYSIDINKYEHLKELYQKAGKG